MAWLRDELRLCGFLGHPHWKCGLQCECFHDGWLLVVSCPHIFTSLLSLTVLFVSYSWTMLYDTIYACQDKKDDVKMGVRSTALLFGSWIRPLLIACAIGFVTMLAFAGVLNGQSLPYFIISVGGTALHLVWQFATVDLEEPASCWSKCYSLSSLNQTTDKCCSQLPAQRSSWVDCVGRFNARLFSPCWRLQKHARYLLLIVGRPIWARYFMTDG